MLRPFSALMVLFVVLYGGRCCGAPPPNPGYTSRLPDICPVVQDQARVTCEGKEGKEECEKYCGFKMVSNSTCHGAVCACNARCAVGGSWGDPHMWSLDGSQFTYGGTCRYVMAKVITPNHDVPSFAITAQDKFYSEDITVPDNVNIVLADWGVDILVGRTLQINGHQTNAPIMINGPRDGQYVKVLDAFRQLHSIGEVHTYYIQTSFGVRLLIERATNAAYGSRSATYVLIPKTSDFLGNIFGVLGRFDGRAGNDNKDANGIPRDLSNEAEARAFGDSFCVGGPHNVVDDAVGKKIASDHQARMAACANHPNKVGSMNVCGELAKHSEFIKCLGQTGVSKIESACRSDTCFSANADEEKAAYCGAHAVANMMCHVQLACKYEQ